MSTKNPSRKIQTIKKVYQIRTISIPAKSNRFEILESKELVEPVHHAKHFKNIITQRVKYRLTNKGEIA